MFNSGFTVKRLQACMVTFISKSIAANVLCIHLVRCQKGKRSKTFRHCKKSKLMSFFWRLSWAMLFRARAQGFQWLYVVFMTSTFFHFSLRRETGSAVSRSSEEESYYRIMKASWVCVFLILTLLGSMSASGNTNTEGKSLQSFQKEAFTFSQWGVCAKKGSIRVLNLAGPF